MVIISGVPIFRILRYSERRSRSSRNKNIRLSLSESVHVQLFNVAALPTALAAASVGLSLSPRISPFIKLETWS